MQYISNDRTQTQRNRVMKFVTNNECIEKLQKNKEEQLETKELQAKLTLKPELMEKLQNSNVLFLSVYDYRYEHASWRSQTLWGSLKV